MTKQKIDPSKENQKPKDIAEYKGWLKNTHQIEISDRTKTYYDAVTAKIINDFDGCEFWQSLKTELGQINEEYYLGTNYNLFFEKSIPKLVIKPFESFLLKTFRQNVINNNRWPKPPDSGWLLPENWYSRVNDILRTYFVVKYLDGVEFLTQKFQEQASNASYETRVDFEAKEEGYYAAHFYVTFPCEIPRENWDTRKEIISVELQITTQLQEVIRRLLHKYYEQRRKKQPTHNVKWQWDYNSDEFATNYLGHILHYVEGMIMDVRDERLQKVTKNEN